MANIRSRPLQRQIEANAFVVGIVGKDWEDFGPWYAQVATSTGDRFDGDGEFAFGSSPEQAITNLRAKL